VPETIVLAYSGGLDTSVALRWLADEYRADVVALLVDVGQGVEVESATARAQAAGAAAVEIVDARRELAEEYVLPTLKAGALYEGQYPLISSLSRPLIARKLVESARAHGAGAVAHGCTGKGNDQVRFEAAVAGIAPDLAVLAPVRDWGLTREGEIAYAAEHGIQVPVKSGAAYSIDANLWGRSIECGPLEDPWTAPPEDAFTLTADPSAGGPTTEVTIGFEAGAPVALDGDDMALEELIATLAEEAGAHGVGRVDMVENRLVGIKSREVYEAPAASVLYPALRALESLVLERDLQHQKDELASRYARLVYNGLWYSPLREALDAFVAQAQSATTGEVRMRLGGGSARVVGRRAAQSLYDHGLATYEEGDAFRHGAAAGFIHLWSLPLRTWSAVHGKEPVGQAGSSPGTPHP
jgi:argininosuccinate synthase